MTKTDEEEDVLEPIYCRVEEMQRAHDLRNYQPRKPKILKLTRQTQEQCSKRLHDESMKDRTQRMEQKKEEWWLTRSLQSRSQKIRQGKLDEMVARLYTPPPGRSRDYTVFNDSTYDDSPQSSTLFNSPTSKDSKLSSTAADSHSNIAAAPPVLTEAAVAAVQSTNNIPRPQISTPPPVPNKEKREGRPHTTADDSSSLLLPECSSGRTRPHTVATGAIRSNSATRNNYTSQQQRTLRLPSPAFGNTTIQRPASRAISAAPEYAASVDPHLFWYRKNLQKSVKDRKVETKKEIKKQMVLDAHNRELRKRNKNTLTLYHKKEIVKKEEAHKRVMLRMLEQDERRYIQTVMCDERDEKGLHPPPISKKQRQLNLSKSAVSTATAETDDDSEVDQHQTTNYPSNGNIPTSTKSKSSSSSELSNRSKASKRSRSQRSDSDASTTSSHTDHSSTYNSDNDSSSSGSTSSRSLSSSSSSSSSSASGSDSDSD